MSIRIALAGNPNCGKTTLFNLLTGSDCHVGNWPGVTVEKRSGTVKSLHGAELFDLPGIYSLRTLSDEEDAALGFLINERPDLIINVINSNDLERSLYLTVQLELLEIPVVAALNMTDVLKKRGDRLDCARLGELLGISAVPVSAAENTGTTELLSACEGALKDKAKSPRHDFLPDSAKLIAKLISPVCKEKNIPVLLETLQLLRGDITACDLLPRREAQIVENLISSNETADCDRELMTVSHIYNSTDRVCEKTLERKKQSEETFSSRADRILLNRFLAVPLFLSAVLLVFYLTFGSLGTRLGELADSFINGALSTALMSVLDSLGASEWVKDLVCDGILAGLGSVCSFLPQIALLFFFLGLLEDCGYMARGAFIADYPLRLLGLGGKSFVPLFMGLGCSVPALMSTRTLHAGREKKICAAVIPFMSCSAKMPVYAMLISAFFPNVRWLAVILVYSLGIACACAGSLILKKTVFKGVEPPFIFELPEYRLPRVRSALRYVRDRLREFLKKAGAVLFPASVIIWALGYFDFSFHHAADARLSMLGRIGGAVSFIFSPLGLGDWRCCVALISGLVARETTVSTLGILMGSAQSVRDIISPQAACAFMSFSLLSMPCVAAVAALRRELGTKSTAKVLIFEFITAWTVSFMIYRLALLI